MARLAIFDDLHDVATPELATSSGGELADCVSVNAPLANHFSNVVAIHVDLDDAAACALLLMDVDLFGVVNYGHDD